MHVAFRGELDIATVPAADAELRRARAKSDVIVLDLRELEFVDSSGAHLIEEAARRIRRSGGRLIVVRGPSEVDWFFSLIGLDRRLELVDAPPDGGGAPQPELASTPSEPVSSFSQ